MKNFMREAGDVLTIAGALVALVAVALFVAALIAASTVGGVIALVIAAPFLAIAVVVRAIRGAPEARTKRGAGQ